MAFLMKFRIFVDWLLKGGGSLVEIWIKEANRRNNAYTRYVLKHGWKSFNITRNSEAGGRPKKMPAFMQKKVIKKHADNHKTYMSILIAVLIMLTGCESRVTPLIEAIDVDNTVRIRELILQDPSLVNAQVLSKSQGPRKYPSARSNIVDRPLHYAAAKGKLEIVNLLIKLGAPVNETVIRGETALHRAAIRAQTDVIKSLIENGANVNARTAEGATPLHYAAKCGCSMGRHIKLLIEHNADREARTKKGQTPLHWAAKWSASTAVLALCANGVNINVMDNHGKHVRDLLQENDRSQTTNVLKDNGSCRQLWSIYQKNKKISVPELELAIYATECESGASSSCVTAMGGPSLLLVRPQPTLKVRT